MRIASVTENIAFTTIPRTTICAQMGKLAEASVNCGRKARPEFAVGGERVGIGA
jgi:hypothetical protein